MPDKTLGLIILENNKNFRIEDSPNISIKIESLVETKKLPPSCFITMIFILGILNTFNFAGITSLLPVRRHSQ